MPHGYTRRAPKRTRLYQSMSNHNDTDTYNDHTSSSYHHSNTDSNDNPLQVAQLQYMQQQLNLLLQHQSTTNATPSQLNHVQPSNHHSRRTRRSHHESRARSAARLRNRQQRHARMHTEIYNRFQSPLQIQSPVPIVMPPTQFRPHHPVHFITVHQTRIPAPHVIERLEPYIVNTNSHTNTQTECCICLDTFLHDIIALKLPCQHIYHKQCIVEWFTKSNECPTCRYQLDTICPVVNQQIHIERERQNRINLTAQARIFMQRTVSLNDNNNYNNTANDNHTSSSAYNTNNHITRSAAQTNNVHISSNDTSSNSNTNVMIDDDDIQVLSVVRRPLTPIEIDLSDDGNSEENELSENTTNSNEDRDGNLPQSSSSDHSEPIAPSYVVYGDGDAIDYELDHSGINEYEIDQLNLIDSDILNEWVNDDVQREWYADAVNEYLGIY